MLRILVVDDSPTIQLQLRRMIDLLISAPHEVDVASDAHRALQLYEKERYDLVLLDMMLLPPGNVTDTALPTAPLPHRLTSLNILRRILATNPEQPVAIISALGRQHPDVTQAMSLGAVGHIEKSVEREPLRRLLAKVLGDAVVPS